jgi:hypothetical protein
MLDIINPEFDIVIGDKTFSVKALSLTSILKLSQSIKNKEYVKNAELVKNSLPKEQRGKFWMDVLQELNKPCSDEDAFSFADVIFKSVPGMVEVIKYAILRNNKIDEAQLDSMLDDTFTNDNADSCVKMALRLIGLYNPEDAKEDAESTEETDKKKSQIE